MKGYIVEENIHEGIICNKENRFQLLIIIVKMNEKLGKY